MEEYNNFPNTNDTPDYSYQKPKKPKKSKKNLGFSIGVVVIACILSLIIGTVSGGLISFVVSSIVSGSDSPQISDIGTTTNKNVNINVDETAETVVEAVAKKVTPSVVGIRTTTSVMNFFGGTSEASGSGSGVVYTKDGYIITNYHVISSTLGNSSSKIEIFMDNDSETAYNAALVGYNISSDLAVLKIDAKNLTPIEFADSDSLKVGQYVITVGSPGGLEFMDSVTYGVISGLNRVVSSDSDIKLIQTDAAINPGNSGGALVNSKGRLVGINSSKIVAEEFEGMGFAIPSNTVKKICDNIISKENSPEPYIGISISEKYTAEVLEYYGFPAGAVVLTVAENSPAKEAGLLKGDIITEFNGIEIKDYTKLEDAVRDCVPGQTVKLKVYRDGKLYSAKITVSSNNAVN